MQVQYIRGINRNAAVREVATLPRIGEEITLDDGIGFQGIYRVREIHMPGSKMNPNMDAPIVITLDFVANLPKVAS